MASLLRLHYRLAMRDAKVAFAAHNYAQAFQLLERAHVLGQRNVLAHWQSHWWMLRCGLRQGHRREVFGQVLRLFAVVPGFVLGWVPPGNTGGANVSALQPMPITDPTLRVIVPTYSCWWDVLIRIAVVAMIVFVWF